MVRRASRWQPLAVDLPKLSTVFEARPCFSWEAPSLWQRPSALRRDSSDVSLWSGAHPWVGQDFVILKFSLSSSVSILPGVTSTSWCESIPWPLFFFHSFTLSTLHIPDKSFPLVTPNQHLILREAKIIYQITHKVTFPWISKPINAYSY